MFRRVRFRSSGSEFQINTYTTGNQRGSSVASLSNGRFIVTWESNGQDGDLYGVYGQVFNEDGTKNGAEFQVNTYTTSYQWRSSVASLGNNQFVVTWTGHGDGDSASGVHGQIFETNITNTSNSGTGSSVSSTNSYSITGQSNPTSSNTGQTESTNPVTRTSSTSSPASSTTSSLLPSDSSYSTRQPGSSAEVISGAERQTTSIALTALSWITSTVKGALGY